MFNKIDFSAHEHGLKAPAISYGMGPQILNFFRHSKRKLLTGGFAETVYLFLKDLEKKEGAFHHRDGEYTVNLSFDLELGLNTPFWEGDIKRALAYGQSAHDNFLHVLSFLQKERILSNVQIVGALLDENAATLALFNIAQREALRSKQELFTLSPEHIEILKSPSIEAGVHGFSHRHFTDLSSQEAHYEMRNAVRTFEGRMGFSPEFMSFPKNYIAHTDVVQKHGIQRWRADTQNPLADAEIPLGLWFAPGVLGAAYLHKLLTAIKASRSGFFLHLWGHFTEMDARVFAELVHVIRSEGWKFTTVKNYQHF